MSFMYRFQRSLLNKVFRIKPKFLPQLQYVNCNYRKKYSHIYPAALGFSFFTWLGLDEQANPEDELIKSIKYSVLYIQRHEYDRAEQLLHVALRQAQQINHQNGITYVFDVLANLALQRKQYEKAKALFIEVSQRLISSGITEDDLRLVHVSVKLARISHMKKEYNTAQLGYEWCLDKLKVKYNETPTQEVIKLYAMAEDWFGRLYVDTDNYEEGFKLMLDSLKLMKKVDDIELEHIIIQLNDIGAICDKMNKIDESIGYFKEAISQAKYLSDDSMEDLGAVYVNLGKAYIKKNMLAEARKNCGYGWRLGQERQNDEVKKEAMDCVKEINSIG